MVFGLLRGLNTPEAGYRAIQASYDKHHRLAERQRIEPVSMGLFGALGSRYKLRGVFVSDMVHMIEVAPFLMMKEPERVQSLADYLMADEIPDQVDVHGLKKAINDAISSAEPDSSAFELVVSAQPHFSDLPIRWIAWLTEATCDRLEGYGA